MNAINTLQKKYNTSNSFSPELLNEIQNALTWAGNSLLQAIYANPRIQHKRLSDILHMSPSSLSNLITKMQTTYDLIHTEKIGRSKYYTLTPLSSEYIKQKLIKNHSLAPIRSFTTSAHTDTLVSQALHSFEHFKNAAGVNWYFCLYNLLIGNADKSCSLLQNIYQDFLDIVCELRIQNQVALSEVYKYINNDEIVEALKQYITNSFNKYELLEPLFILEKNNPLAALTIIDYVFDDLYPTTPKNQPQQLSLESYSLSQEQYHAIFYCITRMTTEYTQHSYNKSSALEHWYVTYHTKSIILFYIAEKCNNVHCGN